MGALVVDVVEVQRGGELPVGRTGEEVQAAVVGEDRVAGLDELRDRREHDDVVEAVRGDGAQQLHAVLAAGVHDLETAPAPLGLLRGEEPAEPVQPLRVDVDRHDQAGRERPVEGVVQRPYAHCAAAAEEGQAPAGPEAHLVLPHQRLGVVAGPEGADDARHRLGQRPVGVVAVVVRQHAALLHRDRRDDAVGRVAAEVGIAVARGPTARQAHGGQDRHALPDGEAVRELVPDLLEHPGELVAGDDGVRRDRVGDALVLAAQRHGLVGREAHAAAHDPQQQLVGPDVGEAELAHGHLVGPVDAGRPGEASVVTGRHRWWSSRSGGR